LYGTTGGRFDHQFATIGLMLKCAKWDVRIYMIDEKNRLSILTPSFQQIKFDHTKRYISFFALEGKVKNLTLGNVEYPLDGYDLMVDDSLCVSNKPLSSSIDVSFDSGYLLAVQSSD
jgi:thiamine pyrophosphokinase